MNSAFRIGRCLRSFCRAAAAFLFLSLGALSPGHAETAPRLANFLDRIPLAEVFPGADRLGPVQGEPAAAAAYRGEKPLGFVYLNSDVVTSIGYSGKPIDIAVGIGSEGKIVGAKLMEHHEPIVLVGIPVARIEKVIQGFVGKSPIRDFPARGAEPSVDIVSGATVTVVVISDSITRSAVRMSRAYGLGTAVAAPEAPPVVKKINEAATAPDDWAALLADGSVRQLSLGESEVDEAFAKAARSRAARERGADEAETNGRDEGGGDESEDETFIDLYVSLVSVPAIGRSVLGEAEFERLQQRLAPGQQAVMIAGRGEYSFKGSGYVRGGIFDRIELVQGEEIIRFHDRDHRRLGDIAAAGAPRLPEIGVFAIPSGAFFDPSLPFTLKLLVQRELRGRQKAFLTFDLNYELPDRFLIVEEKAPEPAPAAAAAPPAPADIFGAGTGEEPLWVRIWRGKVAEIAILCGGLLALTGIFFFQDALVRRPVLYDRVRLAFLAFTLFWIGWYAQAQLSVVNILTFTNALRSGFNWEYFLVDPLIFIQWFAVAAALLFWGRGAYCGWLCPFGALQELLNRAGRLLHIPQLTIPFGVHQRLWPVKYVIFLIIFGLSLYYFAFAEEASEVEPFKTAIVLRFVREWPFVAYAAALLVAGLFIERFFCRYLCPLGAALAIPARLRMFDWLKRYRECGNPCQRCANECPVQSIHPEGDINPNECIQCMHCQMLYHHDRKCPVVVQRRLKAERRVAAMSASMRPAAAAGHKTKTPS